MTAKAIGRWRADVHGPEGEGVRAVLDHVADEHRPDQTTQIDEIRTATRLDWSWPRC